MKSPTWAMVAASIVAMFFARCRRSESPVPPRDGAPTKTVVREKVTVKVLLIGAPDEDGIDPVTGKPVPGVHRLKEMFESTHPGISLKIISIPWGSGATGYGAKTESMIQAHEACVYQMPAAHSYGRRGYLVDLDTLIKNDSTFKDVWLGDYLKQWRGWGPKKPNNQWGLPYRGDNRVIIWDSKLFKDWGVEPLSQTPTAAEIEAKAAKMTGINPVTGEKNYGYWFQGKYAVWQFMAIAHHFGANTSGQMGEDGTWMIHWNTREYLKALEWFVQMAKYAPPGALVGDGMPEGFLTEQNVVAIIPEAEPGYYLLPLIARAELRKRFRVSYNLKGPDGRGGLFAGSPLAMASSCSNKAAAWEVMKWLASSPESQRYNFEAIGNLPVIKDGLRVVPELTELPDAEVIMNQNATADRMYAWAAAQPRWIMQNALEAALAGTLTPKAALEKAQKETTAWLAKWKASE